MAVLYNSETAISIEIIHVCVNANLNNSNHYVIIIYCICNVFRFAIFAALLSRTKTNKIFNQSSQICVISMMKLIVIGVLTIIIVLNAIEFEKKGCNTCTISGKVFASVISQQYKNDNW